MRKLLGAIASCENRTVKRVILLSMNVALGATALGVGYLEGKAAALVVPQENLGPVCALLTLKSAAVYTLALTAIDKNPTYMKALGAACTLAALKAASMYITLR